MKKLNISKTIITVSENVNSAEVKKDISKIRNELTRAYEKLDLLNNEIEFDIPLTYVTDDLCLSYESSRDSSANAYYAINNGLQVSYQNDPNKYIKVTTKTGTITVPHSYNLEYGIFILMNMKYTITDKGDTYINTKNLGMTIYDFGNVDGYYKSIEPELPLISVIKIVDQYNSPISNTPNRYNLGNINIGQYGMQYVDNVIPLNTEYTRFNVQTKSIDDRFDKSYFLPILENYFGGKIPLKDIDDVFKKYQTNPKLFRELIKNYSAWYSKTVLQDKWTREEIVIESKLLNEYPSYQYIISKDEYTYKSFEKFNNAYQRKRGPAPNEIVESWLQIIDEIHQYQLTLVDGDIIESFKELYYRGDISNYHETKQYAPERHMTILEFWTLINGLYRSDKIINLVSFLSSEFSSCFDLLVQNDLIQYIDYDNLIYHMDRTQTLMRIIKQQTYNDNKNHFIHQLDKKYLSMIYDSDLSFGTTTISNGDVRVAMQATEMLMMLYHTNISYNVLVDNIMNSDMYYIRYGSSILQVVNNEFEVIYEEPNAKIDTQTLKKFLSVYNTNVER